MTVLFADLVGFTARAEQLDPEDVRRPARSVPRASARGARALRRHRREVHRRCGGCALRRADRARGRPRARGARCASRSATGWTRRGTSSSCGSPVNYRRGADRARRPAEGGQGDGLGRRDQHGGSSAVGGAGQRHPRRRDHLPCHARRDRLPRGRHTSTRRGSRSPFGSGKSLAARARLGVEPAARRCRPRRPARGAPGCSSTPSRGFGRAREPQVVTSRACLGSARAASSTSSSRPSSRARYSHTGGRVAARRMATASRTGPLQRSSRATRGSSRRTRAQRGREARARDAPRPRRPGRSRVGVAPSAPARRPRLRLGARGRSAQAKHSRPGVGCSRPLRSNIRSCSSSRTSNGRTTGCSTSSRSSSAERAACR